AHHVGIGEIGRFWLSVLDKFPLETLARMPLVTDATILGPLAVALASAAGFFANGGDKLILVDMPWEEQKQDLDPPLQQVLSEFKKDDDDFGLICAPGQTDQGVKKQLVESCGARDGDPPNKGGERFCVAVLDAKNYVGDVTSADKQVRVVHSRDDFGSTSAT